MLNQEILKAQLGSLQASMKFEQIQGFCLHAERWFRDEIGPELFAYLKTLNAATVDNRELLRLTHSCLAWYAYTLAFPHQKFRVGDLGMMKNSAQNTVAVTKWEYVDTRDANLSMLDLSLEYFWRELEIQKPEAWTASAAFKLRNKYFLRSAAELGQLLPIAGRNYRFFQKLITHIEDVENEQIRPALTPAVFADLKSKWQNPQATLSFDEEMLISLIRKALAYLAVYQAWPYLPLDINEDGISEKRSKSGINEGVAPDGNLRERMQQQLNLDGEKKLANVRSYLDETATPILFASYYQKYLTPGTEYEPDDFTDKPHVIL
ncbi:DUF6712 family protein [Spirosoma oryzicola]|uniref:DUF6712 family protein n=1 Tax=Spirosoma oryzicola TaxID=2898794 RepID=UPI001E38F08B|nr:DUF6712 family protein [Spirosoma oryzicola]UHG90100.1 hypothetical protein LQ777_17830 [Spirosoma oryzicola]